MWAAGDYAEIAARELWPLGERIVERVAVREGDDVLDVACGTGNAALRAAAAGGRVVALDLTPELLAAGRAAAEAAGASLDWTEGDAEALPFPDGSYDVVLSVLGVMFAPRHRVAARELARMLRPDGRLAVCSWAVDSPLAGVFRAVARYLPPAPGFASPPWLWGSEEHVRSLFDGTGVELEFERGVADLPPFDSAEQNVEYHSRTLGPLIAVRALTEADGRWPALRSELVELHDGLVTRDLLALGREPAPTKENTDVHDRPSRDDVRSTFRGELIDAGTPGCDRARSLHNAMMDRRPRSSRAAATSPTCAPPWTSRSVKGSKSRFAAAATAARARRRGRRLMIDLGPMNGVRVDPDARLATVGGGALRRRRRPRRGRLRPGRPAASSTTGIGGLTLGGGRNLARKQGRRSTTSWPRTSCSPTDRS